MSEGKLSEDAKIRLSTMVSTNDGFKIADIDLKLRGPGELQGTKQSGIVELKIADIVNDGKILQAARKTAEIILETDPELENDENEILKKFLISQKKNSFDWSKIS
jgi:ATP-dependent DNA helicase RecG